MDCTNLPRVGLAYRLGALLYCAMFSVSMLSERAETTSASDNAQTSRPNIVLLLADDLGFTDIAPFGSEISTPNLSALADNGVIYTNYHSAANCAPARAMLLTGVQSHRAGVPNIPEMIPAAQRQAEHYQGVLSRNVATVASLLQTEGYHTYIVGKWHLGHSKDLLPSNRGFERSVALADSGADNWEQKPYLPIYEKANWYADGEPFSLPEDFYSSRFLVDKTIEFINSNKNSQRPFFAYVPFQAVHIPVQAPQEFIDNYMNTYEQGWHQLRQARLKRALSMGIVPQTTRMQEMATTEKWSDLSPERKRYEAKRMAVYAAMVEAMDHHIGRLIDYPKDIDQYHNTVFIFTSDNGSEVSGHPNPQHPLVRFAMNRQGYSTDYDSLGLKGSFNSISPSFANASASPLAYYKFFVGEGGLRVPLIIAGAGVSARGQKSDTLSHVTDVTPTILSLSKVQQPNGYFGGRAVEKIVGRDLSKTLSNPNTKIRQQRDQDAIGYELAGNAALFLGDYKIVLTKASPGNGQWQLFNIAKDPGETRDLSGDEPLRLQQMLNLYTQYERDNGILPIPEGFDRNRQVAINGLQARAKLPLLTLLIVSVILLPFIWVYRLRKTVN